MLKILFFIFIAKTTCVGQQTFSISGQVVSEISNAPLSYFKGLKIYMEGKTVKKTSLDKNGEFHFKNLTEGRYRIFMKVPDYSDKKYYISLDTLIYLDAKSIKPLTLIHLCPFCDCKGIDRAGALADVKKAYPKLLFASGVSGPDFSRPEFRPFIDKYGVYVQLYDFGCVRVDSDCIDAYTTIAFAYLDKRFGKKWRKYAPDGTINLKR